MFFINIIKKKNSIKKNHKITENIFIKEIKKIKTNNLTNMSKVDDIN